MKPIALYDKSFIQSLNPKEAELFGLLFATNISPVLIQEIGADLRKEETTEPTKYVSNNAIKLFGLGSHLNVDYRILCVNDLAGNTVTLGYRPLSNYSYTNFEDHQGKIGARIQKPKDIENSESGLLQPSLEDQSTLIFERHLQSPERGWGNLMKPKQPST